VAQAPDAEADPEKFGVFHVLDVELLRGEAFGVIAAPEGRFAERRDGVAAPGLPMGSSRCSAVVKKSSAKSEPSQKAMLYT